MNPESVLFSGFIFYSPPINKICLVIAYLQLCKKNRHLYTILPKIPFQSVRIAAPIQMILVVFEGWFLERVDVVKGWYALFS